MKVLSSEWFSFTAGIKKSHCFGRMIIVLPLNTLSLLQGHVGGKVVWHECSRVIVPSCLFWNNSSCGQLISKQDFRVEQLQSLSFKLNFTDVGAAQ